MSFSARLEADYFRVYASKYPEQIGRWIVIVLSLDGIFKRVTQLCVVDDFGNLVRVPE